MRNEFLPLFISPKATITEAIKTMDKIGHKLLCVGKPHSFIGLLSIGDIQRAIIRNVTLNTPVSQILRSDFILGYIGDDIRTLKEKMLHIRAEFMPVLDNNKVEDILFWEDVIGVKKLPPKAKLDDIPVVIMAGGKGSRLRPITNVLPKALIPIGEKTILEEIIDRFVEVGCSEFYLSLNYKADMIRYFFEQLAEKNYEINYFEEEQPLGTAGSLHLLKSQIKGPFFVSNCDIIIEQDYSEVYKYHKESNNEITLVAALKTLKIPYGILETGEGGALVDIQEKPEIVYKINSGLYLLEPHLLNEIPKNQFYHITDLIEKVKKRSGKIGVFPVSENSWKDIGDWDEYIKTREIYGL